MISSENVCTDNIIQTDQSIPRNIYIYIYIYAYMHAVTNSEKRGYEFEGEWGRTI
jgi:hypothetical protein